MVGRNFLFSILPDYLGRSKVHGKQQTVSAALIPEEALSGPKEELRNRIAQWPKACSARLVPAHFLTSDRSDNC